MARLNRFLTHKRPDGSQKFIELKTNCPTTAYMRAISIECSATSRTRVGGSEDKTIET